MTTKLSGSALAGTSLTRKRVDNDYYATPPESVEKLLEGVSRYEMFKNAPLKTVYVFF